MARQAVKDRHASQAEFNDESPEPDDASKALIPPSTAEMDHDDR
jgi:hypothetical protein